MRYSTKFFRLETIRRRFFRCTVGLITALAFAWVSIREVGGVQVLEAGKNVDANPKQCVETKLPAKTSAKVIESGISRSVPDGFSPETLPGYQQTKYSDISWLVTHNAMSNRAEGWWFPNQSYGITRQLNDGVRGLMLDIHMIDDQPFLLHGSSVLGKLPLASGLAEIKAFMQQRSDAVITLILECYAPATKVRESFKLAGLLDNLHQQETGNPWPVISDMIARNKRLVLFTDSGGGEWRGCHDVWKFCQETHYSVKQVADFSFKRNRGHESNPLLILNHFLTRPTAGLALAQKANATTVLKPRLEECEKATKRFPNFVAVDFYECGDTPDLLFKFNRQHAAKQLTER